MAAAEAARLVLEETAAAKAARIDAEVAAAEAATAEAAETAAGKVAAAKSVEGTKRNGESGKIRIILLVQRKLPLLTFCK